MVKGLGGPSTNVPVVLPWYFHAVGLEERLMSSLRPASKTLKELGFSLEAFQSGSTICNSLCWREPGG